MKLIMKDRDIEVAVRSCAKEINKLEHPKLWIILDAGFMFGADLARVCAPADIQLIRVRRGYDRGKLQPPELLEDTPLTFLTKYTHVFVDVIAETGQTLAYMTNMVSDQQDVVTCALITKVAPGVTFAGVPIPTIFGNQLLYVPEFLTGYGMGPYRHLRDIHGLEPEEERL